MKTCPNCGTQLDDSASFCTSCGVSLSGGNQGAPAYRQPPSAAYTPAYDPYDHTAEFDPKDISDNKVICMLAYLLGPVGVIIALLAANSSPYTAFHIRQALKFTVVGILVGLITAVLAFTIIVPIAAGIAALVLLVVKIICFFQVCSGKAVEPVIIRKLEFLK